MTAPGIQPKPIITRAIRAEQRAVLTLALLLGFVLAHADVAFAQQRAAAVEQAAWEAVRTGKVQEAARLFDEAIALRPEDATLFLGAGLAAHLQGQASQARDRLQGALRLDPKLTAASLLFGEIAYRSGDLEAAISAYEAALSVAPEHAQLRARLDAWRKELILHRSFQKNLNAHFTILFEGPAEQRLAGAALDLLEAAYWRIGTALLVYPSDIITVVLYTDEQFRDITRSPRWAGAVYDGKIRVPMRGALNDSKQLEKVLAHEFTHALVRSLSPQGVPTWLDEGLAVAFEKGDPAWAEQVARSSGSVIPLADLHSSFLKLSAEQIPLAYAESALAVQMLLDRSGPLTVATLIKDLAAGRQFAEAFEQRFSLSYSDFQMAWQQRLRGG
jgi:tetratricopeptide (TPR) repeat protein